MAHPAQLVLELRSQPCPAGLYYLLQQLLRGQMCHWNHGRCIRGQVGNPTRAEMGWKDRRDQGEGRARDRVGPGKGWSQGRGGASERVGTGSILSQNVWRTAE